MRIADATRYASAQTSMATAAERQLKATQEASSGTRINAPSDDPVATAQALRVQGALDRTQGFRSSLQSLRADAALAESTLGSAGDVMMRAKEIALQGGSGQLAAGSRAALALEVTQMREQLIALGNTKGNQGYLFGGSKTQAAPFNGGGTFVGDALDRNAEIGAGVVSAVNTSGAKAFTAAGGRDLLADLAALATALSADDAAAVRATVNDLDAGGRQISAARGDAGLKMAKLETADAAHEQTAMALQVTQHTLIDVDPAAAYSRLIQAQQGVESAINVSKTLLDTLRANRF